MVAPVYALKSLKGGKGEWLMRAYDTKTALKIKELSKM
jgi:hypothetical protein